MSIRVTSGFPVDVTVNGGTIKNNGPGTVYYRDESPVTPTLNDGSLTSGSSTSLAGVQWLLSSSTSYVDVTAAAASTSTSGGSYPQGRTTPTPVSENLTGTMTVTYTGAEEREVRGPLTGDLTLNSSGAVSGSRMRLFAIQDSTPRSITIDGNPVTPISQVNGTQIAVEIDYIDVAGTITPHIVATTTEIGKDEPVNTVAASGTAQTIPLPTVAPISRITLTANCTLTFPAAAAGRSFMVVLVQDGTGSRTVTWPTVKWPAAATPTLTTTAAKADIFSFVCTDGTNWFGVVSGQNL